MGGEDEFCGDDVSGQRTGRRQIGDIAFGTAGSVIGLQAEGFTIGGGGIVGGQSGEGGDSGDGGDGVIGIGGGAYAGFAEGHSIGKTSILDTIGVLRFNDGVGGEVVRGAAGRAQRCGLGGEDEFVGYDVSVQCTGVGCGQVGADAVLIVGGESEGFAVGGGGVGEAGEGGDAGCGGLGAVAERAGRALGHGHRLGEIGVGDIIGVLRCNDGLGGQRGAANGPCGLGGEDHFGGYDVGGQRTGVGCGQVGADAVLIVGGESEGFAVGGGGISEAGEGGDAGCGGLSTVAKGAGRGFGQGHRLGEIGIGVAGGILGGDDGLCGQGRTTDGPRRRGGKSYGGGGDVECGTGAIGYGGVGSAYLGTGAGYGEIGIAVYGEDQGLVFSETGIVGVVGVDGIGLAGAVGDGDSEAGEGEGVGAGTVGAADIGGVGSVEAEGYFGEGAGARGVEHDLCDGKG